MPPPAQGLVAGLDWVVVVVVVRVGPGATVAQQTEKKSPSIVDYQYNT